MIGYDRPLHPEWIQEVHKIWQPNMPISAFNEPFKQIAWQVEGLEAKRKARTNLIRYFVAFQGNGNARKTMDKDLFVELSATFPLEKVKSLYLANIVAEVEVIQTIMHFFSKRYSIGDQIEVSKFIEYIKREYGDRDVIRRSVSSFFKTLYYFGLFDTVKDRNYSNYFFSKSLNVEKQIFPYFLYKLIAIGQNKLQFEIQEVENSPLLVLFDINDIESMVKSYQNKYWTISKRIGSEKITFIHNSWDQFL
jgi:hypothetical protein